jgi:hypothetical protein
MASPKQSKKKKTAAAPLPARADAAAEKFTRDLLIRGEAAPLDENGKLPLDATHEIVKEKDGHSSTTKIVRRRFKLY